MTDEFCTCPVPPDGLTIHHPRCGDPGWDAEDAPPTDRLLTDVDAFVLGKDAVEVARTARAATAPRLVGGLASGAQRARDGFNGKTALRASNDTHGIPTRSDAPNAGDGDSEPLRAIPEAGDDKGAAS